MSLMPAQPVNGGVQHAGVKRPASGASAPQEVKRARPTVSPISGPAPPELVAGTLIAIAPHAATHTHIHTLTKPPSILCMCRAPRSLAVHLMTHTITKLDCAH